jgi:hypothetical protein
MKQTAIAFVCMMLLFAVAAKAQIPSLEVPKPAAEVQRLASMLGTWKSEMDKSSATNTCEWFPGGFGLVCHSEGTAQDGGYSGIALYSYDPEAKVYTGYSLGSLGPGGMAKGTVTGNTWLFQSESTANGKPVRTRLTLVEVTPTSQTVKMEISMDGSPWTVVGEAKATKVK